jgi:hypothetical protein
VETDQFQKPCVPLEYNGQSPDAQSPQVTSIHPSCKNHKQTFSVEMPELDQKGGIRQVRTTELEVCTVNVYMCMK